MGEAFRILPAMWGSLSDGKGVLELSLETSCDSSGLLDFNRWPGSKACSEDPLCDIFSLSSISLTLSSLPWTWFYLDQGLSK